MTVYCHLLLLLITVDMFSNTFGVEFLQLGINS